MKTKKVLIEFTLTYTHVCEVPEEFAVKGTTLSGMSIEDVEEARVSIQEQLEWDCAEYYNFDDFEVKKVLK